MGADSGLSLVHPLIARWFKNRLGTPTDVQTQDAAGLPARP